ncbi:GNAT family N-acetyltransferase [Brevibacillus migulae]|uniref:GNAT family N-acetyltransferase n=1 Tax=Brevibacillus migulae TaxID=1644114 RepID=UPI00106DFD9A|nr:GNAT family N-acetyltransferase [Brevibacillus migulae]
MLNGVQIRNRLSDSEIEKILELAHQCNQFEHIHVDVTLNISMLRNRNGRENHDFLYYVDDRLVGFLGMYFISSEEEVELSGMVHPEHRNRKIASTLLTEAKMQLAKRDLRQRLIVCDHSSASGQQFLKAIGATYRFSEYSMGLVDTPPPCKPSKKLELVPVHPADTTDVIRILMESFGDTEQEARELVERNTAGGDHQMYVAKDDTLPIGTITASRDGADVYITAFAVHPTYQGKGYGRQLLTQCIELIRQEENGPIKLDVQTENAKALGLYKACGFQEIAAYDYYSF